MKVYVVEGYTPYEGSETIAVFLSEEKAEQYIKEGEAKRGRNWEMYYVNCYPVEDVANEN